MWIKAMEKADLAQKGELNEWSLVSDFDAEEKIAIFTDLYNQLGIKKLVHSELEESYIAAMEFLDEIAVDNDKKKDLKELVTTLMKREI